MTSRSAWDSLRSGDSKQGIFRLRQSYAQHPTPSQIMEMGVAFLWTGDYQAAMEHFEHAIKSNRLASAKYYGMAGVSYWCMAQPGAAVRTWHAGLDSHFTEGASGVHLPLLLLSASILRAGIFPRGEAVEIL